MRRFSGTARFYEVEFEQSSIGPMALVGIVFMFAHAPLRLRRSPSEYWATSRSWSTSNKFGPAFRIVMRWRPDGCRDSAKHDRL